MYQYDDNKFAKYIFLAGVAVHFPWFDRPSAMLHDLLA